MLISRTELEHRLPPAARAWLDTALREAIRTTPTTGKAATWETRFATAGRHCGQDHADPVRTLLLIEARPDTPTLTRLYQQGSAAERRAILLALPHLDSLTPPDAALPLIEDALRTNDTRLVAAAVGPYAATHLDAHSWRHAVLKCLFTGVSLDTVAELAHRANGDHELARMLTDYAEERTAAGRPPPPDLHHALKLTGEQPEES